MTDKQVEDAMAESADSLNKWKPLEQLPIRREVLQAILTALAELREDRRKRDADVLRHYADTIELCNGGEPVCPNWVFKLLRGNADAVESGKIVVNKESEG